LLFSVSGTRAAEVFGYTEPYRTIDVSAAESGVLTQVNVTEGQLVKKGQILATLDVGVIEQELNISKEELKLKRIRFDKLQELVKNGRASQDEFDRAESELKIDGFKVKRMEAALERQIMRSPVDGVVTQILREVSESVSAANPHVMTVVELSRLRVNIYMKPEAARGYVKGATESLYSFVTRDIIPASIEFVSPVTDAASNTVRVKFLIENPGGLMKSGERVGIYDRLDEAGDDL
jgi:RND family efflux transporter MFP subunit